MSKSHVIHTFLPGFMREWYGEPSPLPPDWRADLPAWAPAEVHEFCRLGASYPEAVRHWPSHAVEWPLPVENGVLILVGRENLVQLGIRRSWGRLQIVTRRPRKTSKWDVREGDLGEFLMTLALSSILYWKWSATASAGSMPLVASQPFWTGGPAELWAPVWESQVTFFYDRERGLLQQTTLYEGGFPKISIAAKDEAGYRRLLTEGWESNSLAIK